MNNYLKGLAYGTGIGAVCLGVAFAVKKIVEHNRKKKQAILELNAHESGDFDGDIPVLVKSSDIQKPPLDEVIKDAMNSWEETNKKLEESGVLNNLKHSGRYEWKDEPEEKKEEVKEESTARFKEITETDFIRGEDDASFETCELTYYIGDGTLASDFDEVKNYILHEDDTNAVRSALSKIEDGGVDIVYVRDYKLHVDYEIVADSRKFKDILRKYGRSPDKDEFPAFPDIGDVDDGLEDDDEY